MKRKMTSVMMMLVLTAGLAGCAGCAEMTPDETAADKKTEDSKNKEKEQVELNVFAAASMTETLTEIGELYEKEHPQVKLSFNFDSSGTLKTQIQEGAACDLFISAGQKQMDQLDIKADPEVNTEELDFVKEDSRINILENKVTLCVSEGSETGIKTFDDLAEALKKRKHPYGYGKSGCTGRPVYTENPGILRIERGRAGRSRKNFLWK